MRKPLTLLAALSMAIGGVALTGCETEETYREGETDVYTPEPADRDPALTPQDRREMDTDTPWFQQDTQQPAQPGVQQPGQQQQPAQPGVQPGQQQQPAQPGAQQPGIEQGLQQSQEGVQQTEQLLEETLQQQPQQQPQQQ
jgi:hypothetical protein